MQLSIVATLYCSDQYITEFYERATEAARKFAEADYEIVFVNDGSPDKSLDAAIYLSENDSHVTVVDLSRNFGHHKAMMTGLAHAKGRYIFLIDSDLEESPEWLQEFSEQMQQEDCDVVYGVQEERKGGFFERWSGELYYSVYRLLTGLVIPKNLVTARLMTRRYVNSLLLHQEREICLSGLWLITGYEQHARLVHKKSRQETSYTFPKKAAILVNSITSFSNIPLIGIFYIGLAISALACIYALYLTMAWLFLSKPLGGWTSVMTSVWLLGGLNISFIGIVGIYLSKIFSETKGRPYTIVRKIYGQKIKGKLD